MESLSKNKLKYLRKFLKKKIRRQERKCLIEGPKLCEEALLNEFEIEILVYEIGRGSVFQDIINHPGVKSVFKANPEMMRELSDVEAPQGIAGLTIVPEPKNLPAENPSHKRYAVLSGISDPGNLGTIIRTASWFGWDGVICSPECAELTSGKVLRSSMGGLFQIPVWENADLGNTLKLLKSKGFKVYGTTARNGSSPEPENKPAAIIIGSENSGIPADILRLCDQTITIPGFGKAESLNAAVSAGILMDRFTKK